MLFSLIVFAVFAALVIAAALCDVVPAVRTWLRRIGIGTLAPEEAREKMRSAASRQLRRMPAVPVADETRFTLPERLRGTYKSRKVQSWQRAALLLGAAQSGERAAVRACADDLLTADGNWKTPVTRVDEALLAYALLIIREGQYQKAREFLVAHQKVQMAPGQRTELLVYYATCCFRLGNLDKGIGVLGQQFRKGETGLLYQTLGYLYVEKYDMDHRPDFAAMAAEAAGAEEAPQADENAAEETSAEESTAEETPAAETDAAEEKAPKLSPEEEWNAGIDKAEKFRIPCVWTTSENSCTGSAGTGRERRNILTRRSPSRTPRLTPCIS